MLLGVKKMKDNIIINFFRCVILIISWICLIISGLSLSVSILTLCGGIYEAIKDYLVVEIPRYIYSFLICGPTGFISYFLIKKLTRKKDDF